MADFSNGFNNFYQVVLQFKKKTEKLVRKLRNQT